MQRAEDGLIYEIERPWTLIKAVVTVGFSSVGQMVIQLTSDYERHSTSTATLGSSITKLSIFSLLNSYVIAILAVVSVDTEKYDEDPASFW